jgi:hypothetical protein
MRKIGADAADALTRPAMYAITTFASAVLSSPRASMESTDALGAAAREVRPRARSRKLQAESSN